MAEQKRSVLVNIADVLPPVVQGDSEVKVTRQRGVELEAQAIADPFANAPVIQADPDTVVTRQKGVLHIDEGAGFVRVDMPAPPVGEKAVNPLAGREVVDRPVSAQSKDAVQTLEGPGLSFHRPLQGGADKVSRQGVRSAAQAEDMLKTDQIFKADQPAKGVQFMRASGQQLPDEQMEAFRRGKVFAVDRPAPEAGQGQPINFWEQQMDDSKFKPIKGGVVQASMKSAQTGKPAVAAEDRPRRGRPKARAKAARRGSKASRKADVTARAPKTEAKQPEVSKVTETAEEREAVEEKES